VTGEFLFSNSSAAKFEFASGDAVQNGADVFVGMNGCFGECASGLFSGGLGCAQEALALRSFLASHIVQDGGVDSRLALGLKPAVSLDSEEGVARQFWHEFVCVVEAISGLRSLGGRPSDVVTGCLPITKHHRECAVFVRWECTLTGPPLLVAADQSAGSAEASGSKK
jgi:hypothetical protein